jgi:tRNA threonylcarbamoyladenosine biosynthesis protein TsaE
LYRLESTAEFLELGLEEILYGQGAVAIEWAERLGKNLPEERLEVHFKFMGETSRTLTFAAFGAHWCTQMLEFAAINEHPSRP